MNDQLIAATAGGTERFSFGRNWARFLSVLDERRIASAELSLLGMLGGLAGRTFLDIGSGSGVFSLAARRLGARVRSFDYDADSVAVHPRVAAPLLSVRSGLGRDAGVGDCRCRSPWR